MTNQIKKTYCLLIIILISSLCFAQKQFHITIQFVPKLDTTNFIGWLNNGKGSNRIPITTKNGKIEISSEIYSKYATLTILSPVTSNQKTFFITKEVSSIIFSGENKNSKSYPFVNCKLKNAIELTNCIELKKLLEFTQKERQEKKDFYEKYKSEFKKSDSLKAIYSQKAKIVEEKNLDFIKLNSNQYFYFWYFDLAFKDSEYIEADSLLQYYKNVLYPKYKNLFEAKFLLDFLKARTLKIDQSAPNFTTTDISGRNFSLMQLKGKYVLLNFWATWCGPCVRELPLIKKLRDDFPENQLEIISISEDNTKKDLEKSIKQAGLNWTHVYFDRVIINKYQVSNGIPLTFLIDKEGRIVFKQEGPLSDTDELRKLLIKK